jgi:hypothetical protein
MSLDIISLPSNVYTAHTFLSSVALGSAHLSNSVDHSQGLPTDCKFELDCCGRGQLVYTAISQRSRFLPLSFQVFKSSLKIVRSPVSFSKICQGGGSSRGAVRVLTQKSKSRLRFTCLNARLPLISQFCLTYPADFPNDGRIVQSHFNAFMTRFRDYCKRRNIDFVYLWVKEFQKRGAPHFHLFLSLPVSDQLHSYMAQLWNRVAGNNQLEHLAFHLNKNNFIEWEMGNGQYLTKYLEKNYQKMTPVDFKNVGRFWGSSRHIVNVDRDITYDDLRDIIDESEIKLIVRWLGRWHENKLKNIYKSLKSQGKKAIKIKSKIRRSIQSNHVFFAAPVFRQIINYFLNLPDPLLDPLPF